MHILISTFSTTVLLNSDLKLQYPSSNLEKGLESRAPSQIKVPPKILGLKSKEESALVYFAKLQGLKNQWNLSLKCLHIWFMGLRVRRSNFMRSKFIFSRRLNFWSWGPNSIFSWGRICPIILIKRSTLWSWDQNCLISNNAF